MALREIRLYNDPILRKKSKEITEITDRIKILLDDMIETMNEAEGVGLAAPQVGVLRRVVVIDVPKTHRNFKYAEAVSERNIMQGVGKDKFAPDRALTRAEAITILIRLLGMQNQAPIKNYTTGFQDDSSIPTWAKDHVYMAKQLDIIDNDQYFYPNRNITKEETAVILVNFINYLQTRLMYDFRENILNN